MRSEASLPYHTDRLQLSTVVFESMVNNLGPRIRRMNFTLHFKTKHEMAAFITAKQRVDERASNDLDLPPSDDEREGPPGEEGRPVAPRAGEEGDCIEIE